jgi:hypothetical protein
MNIETTFEEDVRHARWQRQPVQQQMRKTNTSLTPVESKDIHPKLNTVVGKRKHASRPSYKGRDANKKITKSLHHVSLCLFTSNQS